MPKFSVIVAIHREIIVKAKTRSHAEDTALKLVDSVVENFDLSTEGCDELADDDDQPLTTKRDLRMA